MKKNLLSRFTPPLLNIYFTNVLAGIFLLSAAGPARGQAVFQAGILETGDPARRAALSQQIGDIEAYWIVDIDVAALDSLIRSQGSDISFQFEVGAQFQWSLELSESFSATVGADTLWTKYVGEADSDPDKPVSFEASPAYFNGKIQEPGITYQFFSMYEFPSFGTFNPSNYVLAKKQAGAGPVSSCAVPFPNVPGSAAVVEVAVVIDQGIYHFFNEDEDFVRGAAASLVFEAFSFYFSFNDVPVGPEIREVIIRKDEPLDCGNGNNAEDLSIGLSDFWNRSRPCAAAVLDAFIVFTGQDCFNIGNGQSTTFGICPKAQPGQAIPILYPLSVVEVPGNNLTQAGGLSFYTAHEIGHLLTGHDHLENDPDYESSCPGISAECGGNQGQFPIMCAGGGTGPRDFDFVYIDDCTCGFLAQTIAQNTVAGGCLYPPDESSIPELPCDSCTVFLDIQADNENPVIGCEGQDVVNYTVTLCNYCQADTFNLEIVQFYPEDEILVTQGLDVTEGNDRYIRVNGIELGFDECYELNFTTRVVDVPLSILSSEARVDSIENGVPVEDIATSGVTLFPEELIPPDFKNVSGLLTAQQPPLPLPGTNCAWALYLDNIRVFNTFETDIGAGKCFTFRNSLIELEPGAKIVVSSGNLVLDGCKIFGCDELWESIIVEAGASLEMRNCTVSDAENAVTLLAGSQAEIRNNTFRNNYAGILVGLQPGQTASLRNCYGNTFLADGALKAPRSGTTAFAGIWLDNASVSVGVAGQGPNVFDGLYTGILARNSSLRVTNATFRNLLGDASQAGRGIHAFGSPTGYSMLYVSSGEGRPVLFDNCATGIRASGVNAYVFNTVMAGVNTGLRLASCRDKNLRIWGNDIQARDMGIALLQNNPRFCSVFDNALRIEGTGSFQDPAAIVVDDNAFGATGYNRYLIRQNNIQVSNIGTGIRMGTARKVQARENTILLQDEEKGKTGIRLSGTADAWLRCNTVMGPPMAPYSVDSYGFDATGASGTLITCNTTSNTRLGFRFEGMGDAVQFQGNTIQDHFDGLLIEETGAIGLQEHQGNLWCGAYAGVGARHLASSPLNVQSSIFTVDADEVIAFGCEVLPTWDANTDWFFDQDVPIDSIFQCNAETGDACSTIIPPSKKEPGEEDELLQKLADGTFESPKFEEALKWTGQRHLYYRLLNEEAEALESWEEDFLDDYESTTVGEFSRVDTILNTAFTLGEHAGAALDSLHNRVESKLDSLHWIDWQFSFGIEVDTVALLTKYQSLLDSLGNLYQEGEDQMEAIQLYREDFLEEAEVDNIAISASEVFEVNEQDVNALFLETVAVGIDTLTEAQIVDLWAIANQCPLAGGDAVFKARSLYSLVDPMVKYEDKERCASEPEERAMSVHQSEIASGIQLIPNPAKDELQVKLANPVEAAPAQFIVYDTRGRIHLEKELDLGRVIFTINTSQLSTGIYYCMVKSQGSIHKTEKLIIIR